MSRIDDADWLPTAPSADLTAGLDALAGGHLAEAAARLATAPETASNPHAAYRLGVAQSLMGDTAAAAATWRRVLRLDAQFVPALYDLALAHLAAEDTGQAFLAFTRLLDACPEHAEGRFNFGNLLFRLGHAEEAVAMYAPLTAGANPPRGVLVNLGRALRRLGRLEEALACYGRVLLADPHDCFAWWNRSHALFLMGRWAEGFTDWERRLAIGKGPPFKPALPRWTTGNPPQSLLVMGEQGHGDALHALRWLPPLSDRGCRLTLALHPALVSLTRTLLPEIPVLPFDRAAEAEAEAWSPLFSLPARLALPDPADTAEPAVSPLFAAGLAGIRAAAEASGPRPRIGVVWAGNPEHDNDRWRSMPLSALAPLFAARPDAAWISLQTGAAEVQAEACPALRRPAPPADFLETARRIAGLDLLVTVDTAAAHLGGLLGVPTWMMVAAEPDWRWGLTGERTPWYASLRLFRQTALGDWTAPVAKAAAALEEK
jgi:Flp pilus assembly protein TadD